MKIKHRLGLGKISGDTITYAEVVIPKLLNDSTLVKFLQSIAWPDSVGSAEESYRLHDGIGVSGFELENIALENFEDYVLSKEAKDFFTECVKIKVDEFVFVNFK